MAAKRTMFAAGASATARVNSPPLKKGAGARRLREDGIDLPCAGICFARGTW
ncbi:hypothetical protein [Lysobacter gummosus]|uniref:hypothetical protein n=1 Tax=Lysobacter gummosus TaxID=262324 RepID=UPI0036305EFA